MCRLLCRKFHAIVWATALLSVVLGAMGSRAQVPPFTTKESPWGFITVLKTTVTPDVLGVTMDAALAGCDNATEYSTIPDDEGRKLQHAVLLGAFLNHKRVRITTRLCGVYGEHIIATVAVRDD
jgi:hypothetical protein